MKSVVFTQISDGLLKPNPTPPERVFITKPNAMGLHDKNARIELVMGQDLKIDATVGEIVECLFSRLGASRRQRLSLHFWGKELDDMNRTLMECRVVTNSELTLSISMRTHEEMAAMRKATPLQKVRISSFKIVGLTIEGLTPLTTLGDLRKAVHARLHSPLNYIAVENWKPEADTLVFKRGDQLVKEPGGGGGKKGKGGMKMRNLTAGGNVGMVAAPELLVECRVELADTRLFYRGLLPADEITLDELGMLNDDVLFLDIKRPPPFDVDPAPPPAKVEKKPKGKGKGS